MTVCANNDARDGDFIWPVSDSHDMVPDRSGKKIERCDQRSAEYKSRGRS